MYDEDDPLLARVREVCLALPESAEVESWGRPTFRAGKKIFAVYGASGEDSHALIVKPDPAERDALVDDPRFFSPPYFGPSGWLALDLDAAAPDWDEVTELATDSYRQVALVRMLKALDA
ncbi:UNVERIFIED_CONTAM: hypothetical protein LK11_04650 [Mumia flava]